MNFPDTYKRKMSFLAARFFYKLLCFFIPLSMLIFVKHHFANLAFGMVNDENIYLKDKKKASFLILTLAKR